MKITDGLWLQRNGAQIRSGVEVVEVVESKDSSLKVLVATKHVADRGATLNSQSHHLDCSQNVSNAAFFTGPLLTVDISSPVEDIVKVTLVHHKVRLFSTPQLC